MSRQFNPDLFEEDTAPKTDISSLALGQLETLKRRVRDLELQNHQLLQKIERMALHYEQKNAQISAQQKSFDATMKQKFDDLHRNQTILSQRMNERKVVDTKMQELVDRHNQLVQSFESRMGQAQKVTKDQEMKLLTYQSTLNDILKEIRNLK